MSHYFQIAKMVENFEILRKKFEFFLNFLCSMRQSKEANHYNYLIINRFSLKYAKIRYGMLDAIHNSKMDFEERLSE